MQPKNSLGLLLAAAILLASQAHATATYIGGVINLTSSQVYTNPVVLTNDTTILSTTGASVTFASTVDGAHNLTIGTAGMTTFDAAVGVNTNLTSLVIGTNATLGPVTINNRTDLLTSGDQTYNTALILGGYVTLASDSGNITFASTIDGIGLSVLTPGNTTFSGLVGGTTALNSLNVDGPASLATSAITTVGTQFYGQAVALNASATLTSTGGAIIFDSTIDGAQALTVGTVNGTTFAGVVGGTTPLSSLTFVPPGPASVANINTTSITTSGAQSYGSVILSNSPAITSTAGGTLSFGTIDGAQNLTVSSSGVAIFNGVVGGSTALTSLAVTGSGTCNLNTTSVTTSGTQFYYESVLLETNVSLNNTSGGSIILGAPINGAQSLTTVSSGTAVFNGPVGNTTPLSTLTLGGGGTAYLNTTLTTTGAQLYSENVAVTGPVTCASVGGGTITFASTVGGPSTLTLSTSGTVALDAAVGSATPLAGLTVGGGGNLAINGGLVRTIGAQTCNETAALGGATTLSGSPLSLPALDGYGHVLTLSNSLVSALGGSSSGLAQLVVAGGGSVALDCTFSAPSITVTAPATLTGSGIIIAPVSVQPGATLAPSLSSGPFTLFDSLSLSGATVMELNPAVPTNDLARTFGSITYGGTLTVTNLAGTLAAGDSFRLFQGASYADSFTNFNLPPLSGGLFWDTRGLTNNGSILVAALPSLTSIATIGPGAFQLTATGTPNEAYYVLASTNVALPVAQWWMLGSATANSSGAIGFTDSTATNGSRFYRFGQ